jgi:hypothetical protein
MSNLRTDELDMEGRARAVELEAYDPERLAWHAAALEDELRALREDKERLDWLEAEMLHEEQALSVGLTPAPSLFRANLPITRVAIDEHRLAHERRTTPA